MPPGAHCHADERPIRRVGEVREITEEEFQQGDTHKASAHSGGPDFLNDARHKHHQRK